MTAAAESSLRAYLDTDPLGISYGLDDLLSKPRRKRSPEHPVDRAIRTFLSQATRDEIWNDMEAMFAKVDASATATRRARQQVFHASLGVIPAPPSMVRARRQNPRGGAR